MSSPYATPASGPEPQFTPAPASKPSRAPRVLMTIGGAIIATSVIIGVIIALIGLVTTLTTAQGEVIQLYAEEGTAAPTCTLYTPDGAQPEPGTYQSSTRSLGDTSWESFDSFTAPSSGEYEIDCAGMPVAVGPPVSVGGILGAVGGILFAIGGGFLGFVLLAIGIVLWLLN